MSRDKLPAETVRQIPMFRHLSGKECQQVLGVATNVSFGPGDEVLQQGATCQNLWIVLEGKCEVVKHGEKPGDNGVVLATLGAYENFGEMSFFQVAPHSAAVRARTKVKLLRITRSAYDGLIRHGDTAAFKLAYNTVESLAERLRRMDEWVAELLAENERIKHAREWSNFRDKLFKEWNL